MDPIEDRLRQLLRDDGWDVPADDEPLEAIHHGARRRRRRRQAMASGAVVVVLAVGAGGLVWSDQRPSKAPVASDTPKTRVDSSDPGATNDTTPGQKDRPSLKMGPGPNAAEAPVPAGFAPVSVTAVSPKRFWTLGEGKKDSRAAVVGTMDGGGSFSTTGEIDATVVVGDNKLGPGTVRDVRFASAEDGWAYGGSLWSTHDGGTSWSRDSAVEGMVTQLATADGQATALARSEDGWALWHTPSDRSDWRRLDVSVDGPGDLIAGGSTVALTTSTDDGAGLLVSTDAGTKFSQRNSPCPPGLSGGRLSGTRDSLWLLCATGTAGQAHVSTDAGETWSPVHTGGRTLPNSGSLGARSTSTAVVSTPGRATEVAGDTGSDQATVKGLKEPRYVGFTTDRVGYIVDAAGGLFRTTDGADTWRRVTID